MHVKLCFMCLDTQGKLKPLLALKELDVNTANRHAESGLKLFEDSIFKHEGTGLLAPQLAQGSVMLPAV